MGSKNYNEAIEIFNKYNLILADIRTRIEEGDMDAAIEHLKTLTERNKKLKYLGYMVTGSDDYRSSRLMEMDMNKLRNIVDNASSPNMTMQEIIEEHINTSND